MADLDPIPLIDIRDGGPLRHACEGRDRALALRDDCLGWFPPAVAPLVPVMDRIARHWLRRSCSPYLAEVASIAAALRFPGVWFLNGSYQWGCTTLARDDMGGPWLARTLDWPFPGLGRHVVVARMQGPAGEFFNITWPGYVGALTAMAPKRFAAAINQAPLRRRTRHPWLRPYDMAVNAATTWRVHHIPPDQLLRTVFETCASFAEARAMLESVPVARPVIFTLAGAAPGERCVIERTENRAVTHDDDCAAANDWLRGHDRWEARIGADRMLTCPFEEAAESSRARREALKEWSGEFARDSFGWVLPPVLNRYTRIAVEMCAATGTLRVVGYELSPGAKLPQPVTRPCEVSIAA